MIGWQLIVVWLLLALTIVLLGKVIGCRWLTVVGACMVLMTCMVSQVSY